MIMVPRDAKRPEVLDIVRDWIDVLSAEDFRSVANALGYGSSYGRSAAESIRNDIQSYRSDEFFPGVETFCVSNWRTATGGNPNPMRQVIWYRPNSMRLAGSVAFALPLNGKWSDLIADFVFLDRGSPEGYVLSLEDISPWSERKRAVADFAEEDTSQAG